MHVFLAAVEQEIAALKLFLDVDTTITFGDGTIWHGKIGTHDVCLARCGMSDASMQRITEYLLRTFRVKTLVIIGFAGGTRPEQHAGDLVIGSALVDTTTGARFETPPTLIEHARACATRAELDAEIAVIAQHNAIVAMPHEKAALGAEFHAHAICMEGITALQTAQHADIPACMVRTIFDTLDMELVPSFAPLHDDGTLALAKVAWHLAHNPSTLLKLPAWHMAAHKAQAHLTTFVKTWLTQG